MTELSDPVQRHIYAMAFRDTIVPDDASDLNLGAVVSAKQLARLQRAMLRSVDFVGADGATTLDDPVGRRVGRVAFNEPLRALWIGGRWTGTGPAPHQLPDSAASIAAFVRQQTHLADDQAEDDARVKPLLGFSIAEHARVTDLLRAGGGTARLFIAASMLSAAAMNFEKARQRTASTGRQRDEVSAAAMAVEAALIGTARIATDVLLNEKNAPYGIFRIAAHLVDQVEAVRRARPSGNVIRSVRFAAAAANAVHLWLTRGVLRDVPSADDLNPGRLPGRLVVTNAAMAPVVAAMVSEVTAIDTSALYVLLMARRLQVALESYRWLAAPHPVFRLNYGYIGGHALFVEVERLGAITATMTERQSLANGTTLDSVMVGPVLSTPADVQSALHNQSAPGRYLALGAYHRAVITAFIGRTSHWLATTVPTYTHHSYSVGSRFCDLTAAAGHEPTHDFIRRTELDKPSQQGTRRQPLVLFYGLDISQIVILGLRQILDRLICRGAPSATWRAAFGHTVHRILMHTAPSIAARLEMSSYLTGDPSCKSLINRATALASRYNDQDYERPAGIGFDYSRWFRRDRDVAFWDRLQKGAKLYGAFGSAYITGAGPIDIEPVPGRQGRRSTQVDGPPSLWQQIMAKAKLSFDAYQPLYLKSRPSLFTARIMARMNEGYSAFASDPQFRMLFKL